MKPVKINIIQKPNYELVRLVTKNLSIYPDFCKSVVTGNIEVVDKTIFNEVEFSSKQYSCFKKFYNYKLNKFKAN